MKYLTILLSILSVHLSAQDQQLYHVILTQAAPGELLNVIDLMKQDIANHEEIGIAEPTLIRHSQGDKWDLMMIYPFASFENHYIKENYNILKSAKTLSKTYGDPFLEKIAWQEESVMYGPDVAAFLDCSRNYDFFHIEIFRALPGKQAKLLEEREMENVYLEELDRRPNLIFTKVMGASWDTFTMGCYQDLLEYASRDSTDEEEEAAAKKAGFEGANYIGAYLRELIAEHHDTLAGAVK